ncbi:CRISPR-associated helicase Cas3' [Actinoplanes sp. NPDC049668]|uniref:CRISPR-associated helicase Cas3' n=1 Tax=unclassified Actinoplanes TaxID=2626549 RepID=UPI00339E0004
MYPSLDPVVGVFWGKSKAGPAGSSRPNLLIQHLLDTAAVAELLWDRWFSAGVRTWCDDFTGGQGRAIFSLLCGLHDVGKASPAFQSKVPELAARVQAAGLMWGALDGRSRAWHHTLAGAVIVDRVLDRAGWSRASVRWVAPLIAGHHGVVPGKGKYSGGAPGRGDAQGIGPRWMAAQDAVVAAVVEALGLDLGDLRPRSVPRRAEQLAFSGAIIMADWIASGSQFAGVDEVGLVSMAAARDRAESAWRDLDLHGGWAAEPYVPVSDLTALRFGRECRPVQRAAVAVAEQMPTAGLMMIEAPMGEGKTEAALAAAEVLARRFGANGVFVGMPTQATSDPMFSRVLEWAQRVQPGTPVGLLHGKRQFNKQWRELREMRFLSVGEGGTDEFGCSDEYGLGGTAVRRAAEAPSEWFLAAKRGLLMPMTVGTVDQLLHAATRTRHVMLRHAGLAGRVVILDEVHAYDVYMEQFLCEVLRWLADAGVPVILLSATLPPPLRERLAVAYLQGSSGRRDIEAPAALVADGGYPVVRSGWLDADGPGLHVVAAPAWRDSVPVRVEVLPEGQPDGPDAMVAMLQEDLADGGCALIVRNTVGRAQHAYRAVRAAFGDDEVVLLHSRLTVGERADRSARILDLLGPPGRPAGADRPRRLIVVATQLAEQSFDIDVDLLVTDVAPIDLLLQRAGRLHRHARRPGDRPSRVSAPRVVVTGMRPRPGQAPIFVPGSTTVYGDYLLLHAAHLVLEAANGPGWHIPRDVPALVRRGYADSQTVPDGWSDAVADAKARWQICQQKRASKAGAFLLAGEDALGLKDLAGLHEIATADLGDDDAVAAVVRDGPESVEVILVRHDERGFQTLQGRALGTTGAALYDQELVEAVLNTAVRMPPYDRLTVAAKAELRPLPECGDDPWLRRTRALILDGQRSAVLGGYPVVYDDELGLLVEPAPAQMR